MVHILELMKRQRVNFTVDCILPPDRFIDIRAQLLADDIVQRDHPASLYIQRQILFSPLLSADLIISGQKTAVRLPEFVRQGIFSSGVVR